MVQEFGLSERVTIVEGNYPERWRSLVAQSDVALHLTSNPHGRLSPYLELSMAAGVPTVVMRSGRGETLADDVAFSIAPGLHETAQLVGVLEALGKSDARVFGKAGQTLVKEQNDPVRVAAQLGSMFRESAPLLASVMKAWEGLYARGEQALMDEIKALTDAPVGGMPGAFETIVAPFVAELRRSHH
jgi:glycosyltransferase involved in cell wall biosynthesis